MFFITLILVFLLFNAILYIIDLRRKNRECEFLAGEAEQQFNPESVYFSRYQGKWFENAVIPNSFESGCVGATAEYQLNGDGFDVTNTCFLADGTTRAVQGVAKPYDGAGKFQDRWAKVSFFGTSLPNFYAQFFQGDYLILHVTGYGDAPYGEAIVGSIDKQYLWILSRQPNISQERLQALVQIARAKGYNVSKLLIRNYK